MSCNVCCSNYNKSLHSEVKCYFPSCEYSACKECIRTYLTGTTSDPHCMKCKNKWSLEFTKTSLNASFMETDYKNHRKEILADRAIAQIPEYYEGALRYGQLTESDMKLKEIMAKVAGHRAEINKLYVEYDRVRREMENKAPTESRKFVMQCQNDGCRGMLTTQYKCDICTKFTCPKCFLAIEGEKADHVCKQEDIDTVEELRKNTRPCPNCGLRISKIDGCDQMWCIECKTAFSWSKGTVEKGVVHNPHYYQWMRQNGGVPRNPNEHNEGCGNDFINTSRKINEIVFDCLKSKKHYVKFSENVEDMVFKCEDTQNNCMILKDKVVVMMDSTVHIEREIRDFCKYFSGFHRYINHMEYTELRPILNNIRTREQNRDAIYQYILNQINKNLLSEELIRADNLNMKERAHCDILEALVVVGKQLMIDCMKEIETVAKNFPLVLLFNTKIDEIHFSGTKWVKDFLTNSVNLVPEEITNFQNNLHVVFEKYKTAISKYCAYSNIESIKFLMTYASKKTLITWNYFDGCVDHSHFKTKGEMVQAMNNFKVFYESCNDGIPQESDNLIKGGNAELPLENTFVSNETISSKKTV